MTNGTASLAGNFAYTAPGGAQVNEQVAPATTYADSAVGFETVPDTTPSATVFTIPVGAIGKIRAFRITNKTGQEMGVRFGTAVANEFNIPNNAEITMFCPTAPAAAALDAIKLVTTTTQAGDGTIEYRVFGDP